MTHPFAKSLETLDEYVLEELTDQDILRMVRERREAQGVFHCVTELDGHGDEHTRMAVFPRTERGEAEFNMRWKRETLSVVLDEAGIDRFQARLDEVKREIATPTPATEEYVGALKLPPPELQALIDLAHDMPEQRLGQLIMNVWSCIPRDGSCAQMWNAKPHQWEAAVKAFREETGNEPTWEFTA